MAWTYSDWISQSGDAARLERLELHIKEVSDKIDIDVEADGLKKLASPVRLYHDKLMREREILERRTRGRTRRRRVSHRVR